MCARSIGCECLLSALCTHLSWFEGICAEIDGNKREDFGIRTNWVWALAVWPWTSCFISLNLSCLGAHNGYTKILGTTLLGIRKQDLGGLMLTWCINYCTVTSWAQQADHLQRYSFQSNLDKSKGTSFKTSAVSSDDLQSSPRETKIPRSSLPQLLNWKHLVYLYLFVYHQGTTSNKVWLAHFRFKYPIS